MTIALIFDVETTGLLPQTVHTAKPEDLPNIIQLSYILYDIDQEYTIESFNAYVQPKPTMVLTSLITKLTGITREQLEIEGIDIKHVIQAFYRAYEMADIIVGHNIQFDINMILLEDRMNDAYLQGIFNNDVLKQNNKKIFCTMKAGIKLCNLQRTNTRGVYLKQPKLSELYEHLFYSIPQNLHNSMVDVAACLRCFLKMYCNKEIADSMFDDWIP